MIKKVIKKGINIKYITLHISYNTFKPITSSSYLDHNIGSEYIDIQGDLFALINNTKRSQKRVIAVGTTVTRAIEFCYHNNINFISYHKVIWVGKFFIVINNALNFIILYFIFFV